MHIELTDKDLNVIINALNFAKNEWALIDDDEELSALADQADSLEMRLKNER